MKLDVGSYCFFLFAYILHFLVFYSHTLVPQIALSLIEFLVFFTELINWVSNYF